MGMCSVYNPRKVIMHKRCGFSGLPKTIENLALLRRFFASLCSKLDAAAKYSSTK